MKHSLRNFIVIIAWLSLTSYIWISSRSSCDSNDELPKLPSEAAHLLVDKKRHLVEIQSNHGQQRNEDPLHVPSEHDKSSQLDQDDPSIVEMESENVTLALALQEKWVGFPEIAGDDCQEALYSTTKNEKYPQSVRRTRPMQYILDSKDCKFFRKKYGFIRYSKASEEEKSFPIAFIILFYKDLDQVVYLLRALYRPHNAVCLSIDTKASIELLEAARSVAKCLPNVFVASKLEHIVYAGFSRLMADINCMEDLLNHPVQWKYVINMPGQQFPLRTNLEMVKILQLYNGANDIEGLTGDMLVADRYEYKHTYVTDTETGDLRVKKIFIANDPPPHGLEMIKGSTYGTFSRAFVEFALRDPKAKDFLEWSKTIKSPDEYFWGTLHHTKKFDVPGGFKGEPHHKPWLTSYSVWITNPNVKCATMYVHKICIFSPEDFPSFIHRGQLFANKFYITHHPAALHCLDEMLVNLTFTGKTRDLSFYKRLPFALKPKDG